jgi:hypothetical protein
MAEVYFDIGPGDLIVGEAAVEQRMQQVDPRDILPLRQLLTSPDFPYARGDYAPLNSRNLNRNSLLEIGKWVLTTANSGTDTEPIGLSGELIERAYVLGISPSYDTYKHRGLPIRVLAHEIGVPTRHAPTRRGMFDSWSIQDFVDHAGRVIAFNEGEPPTAEVYEAYAHAHPEAPTLRIITLHTPGTSMLNECHGFPDVANWDHERYIAYGAAVAEVNGSSRLTTATIAILSRRRRGPDAGVIAKRFEGWSTFKELALKHLAAKQTKTAMKASAYRAMATSGRMPAAYVALPNSQLVRQGGGYRLLHSWPATRKWTEETKVAHAARAGTKLFTSRILTAVPGLTAADLEKEAERLGIKEDTFPLPDKSESLRVTPEEYETYYRKKRAVDAKRRQSHQTVET